jgi:hypothetical protein
VNKVRRERLFIVRMWLEPDSTTPPMWRGSIHDVAADLKRYVTGPEEAAEFIAIRLSDTKA